MRTEIHDGPDFASELPHLVRLSSELYAAVFFLMKLLPARYMIDEALRTGELESGGHVIETTSGTFGLALAMVCRLRGLDFTMVTDPVAEPALCRRIRDLGATVHIVEEPAPVGGFQRARLDVLHRTLEREPKAYWPRQYENARNPGAYAALAELLASSLGQIDCVVGTVGSGGSMCGTVASLRLVFPSLVAIGVDTFASRLFGQPDGKRLVRGLGNSLVPANVDHSLFDEVHWLDAATVFKATRVLHQRHALYMGPTSGAAYWVASWFARHHPDRRVVVLLPDEGYRYENTVYNDEWLVEQRLNLATMPIEPQLIASPSGASCGWARYLWTRRSLSEVLQVGS